MKTRSVTTEQLIKTIAYKYYSRGASWEDLIQQGWLGVLRAKKRYREEKLTVQTDNELDTFHIYASYFIKGKMQEYIKGQKYKAFPSNTKNVDSIGTPFIFPSDAKKVADELLGSLPDRDRDVLISRYYKEVPLRELAEYYEVSIERIRQIEQESINKLKQAHNGTA